MLHLEHLQCMDVGVVCTPEILNTPQKQQVFLRWEMMSGESCCCGSAEDGASGAVLGVGIAENSNCTLSCSTMTSLGSIPCGSSVSDVMTFSGATTVNLALCISMTGPNHRPSPVDALTNAQISEGVFCGQSDGVHQCGSSKLVLTLWSVEG